MAAKILTLRQGYKAVDVGRCGITGPRGLSGSCGMKWKRRLLLLALFLAVFAGALTGGAWWMARGEPEWYSRSPMDPAALEAAAARAERQMQRTLSWAQDQQAYQVRSARGAPST